MWRGYGTAGWLSYGAALAVGTLLAAQLFAAATVLATDPVGPALTGDPASHLIAMRYFLAAPWSWPPLRIPALGEAPGTNLGLADGIPLASLAAKLLRPVLPASFQPLYAWLALCYVLQPVAAVFAVRSAGERRLVPALAVAVLAVSLPMWLTRSVHAALSAHFLILLAIGLYARACAGRRWAGAAGALLLVSLLVHPYLMAMVAAVLAAVPLSLLARGDRGWLPAALAVMAGLAATAALAAVLGYGGLQTPDGFGVYSMNLLAPVYPAHSGLLGSSRRMLDATGEQWEGTAYLGLGLAGLLLAAAGLAVRAGWTGWRRHAGLLCVCMAMAAFALSNRVFAGRLLLLDLPAPPESVQHFRATGRFIWPATYAALVSAVVLAARLPARAAAAVLAVAALVQLVDVTPYRRAVARELDPPKPWSFDPGRVRAMMAASRTLSIHPRFYCGANWFAEPALAQVLEVASSLAIPVDTFPSARLPSAASCDDPPATLQPGELRLYVARRTQLALALPGALHDCRMVAGFAVCTKDGALLAGLPQLSPAMVPELAAGPPATAGTELPGFILPWGWASPQPEGRWTLGEASGLLLRTPVGRDHVRLRLQGFALAPTPGGTQDVSLTDDGRMVGQWRLQDRADASLDADIPAGDGPHELALHVARPVRPADRGINGDGRPLGFFLRSIQVGPAGG